MSSEHPGGVTIQGNPLTTLGDKVNVGDSAPTFEVRNSGMEAVSLDNWADKIRLISVIPSLDTGICDAQTRRMNEEATKLGDDVVVLTISAEHPFNQKRWCGAAGIENVEVLSDHYDMSFGQAFGTHIKEWRLEQRAMFVIDQNNVVRYAEYVPEIAQHPDYDGALAAVASVKNG
ncbi:MAG: thiol peroxidase [Ardenticatenaceae bacterium]|nr:thiol peroxidase [Ardenticatenaceae bacterium]